MLAIAKNLEIIEDSKDRIIITSWGAGTFSLSIIILIFGAFIPFMVVMLGGILSPLVTITAIIITLLFILFCFKVPLNNKLIVDKNSLTNIKKYLFFKNSVTIDNKNIKNVIFTGDLFKYAIPTFCFIFKMENVGSKGIKDIKFTWVAPKTGLLLVKSNTPINLGQRISDMLGAQFNVVPIKVSIWLVIFICLVVVGLYLI